MRKTRSNGLVIFSTAETFKFKQVDIQNILATVELSPPKLETVGSKRVKFDQPEEDEETTRFLRAIELGVDEE